MANLASVIIIVTRGLMFVILADVIASYFLAPYHSIRRFLDSLVEPLLVPIRRLLPPMGVVDFSPLILLILIEVIGRGLAEIIG